MFFPIYFFIADGEHAKLQQGKCHSKTFPKTCRNSKLVLLRQDVPLLDCVQYTFSHIGHVLILGVLL